MENKLKISIEYTKILVWPIITIFLLIAFWSPIKRTVYKLPDIVSNTESITIAGLSVKIGNQLRGDISKDVKKILATLTPNEVKLLMAERQRRYYKSPPQENAFKRYGPLLEKGLIEEIQDHELGNFKYGLQLSKIGKETIKVLDLFREGFVKEIISNQSNDV